MSELTGGAQQNLISGGAQSIADKIAEELKDAIHLETPVRALAQDATGVTVKADALSVHARRAVVTIPATLQGKLQFEPALPSDRAQLLQRMPMGSVVRAVIEWDQPFWRAEGLSGEAVDFDSPIAASIDASPADAHAGVLSSYAFGPPGREVGRMEPEARKALYLRELTKRLGPKTASPVEYKEYIWHTDPWSGGAIQAHYPTGVLTTFGRFLRPPVGRIHWAGTECATRWAGFMEGAVRSGERAAAEVLAAD